MSTAPVITIFVRHSADCKYAGDEFCKRCNCRKHFRWTQNGQQFRRKAGTRSWGEAEEQKRRLEDQLAGRTSATTDADVRTVQEGVDVFLEDKKVQGVTESVMGKYTRELARLREYCERNNVHTVQGITRELLTGFCATWPELYPSTYTRAKVRERVRSFLRYCYEAQWIPRIPALPKIKIEEPPTLPLSEEEYKRLLRAINTTVTRDRQSQVHALIQLMRYSGLAIRDALTLKRSEMQHDKKKGLYRIVTARQKTGTHVSVPIPPDIAQELLTVLNGNPEYVFWSGVGEAESITKSWAKLYLAPLFKAAKLSNNGYLKSHRLRDTFAVDLLEKGVPLEEVSKLLGHESIKTTERHYSKWMKGRQDRLDTLVVGTWAGTERARPLDARSGIRRRRTF
ncbi:MAG: tyrosine-type recombinase/integrase [Candidatus Sulfotelmatobacter sp.]